MSYSRSWFNRLWAAGKDGPMACGLLCASVALLAGSVAHRHKQTRAECILLFPRGSAASPGGHDQSWKGVPLEVGLSIMLMLARGLRCFSLRPDE